MVAAAQRWQCRGYGATGDNDCTGLLPATFEVDHHRALTNGGTNNWSNLVALCPSCHRKKTIYDRNPNTYERHTGKSKYFAPGPLAPEVVTGARC